jgi:hypothetical protein
MSVEYLVNDSIVVCVTINNDIINGSSLLALSQSLGAICQPPKSADIFFNRRAHLPDYDDFGTGCFWAKTDDGGGTGQIVVHPVGLDEVRIRVEVTLVIARDQSKAWPTVDYNPTTMLVGSNVHPAIFTDPHTGDEVLYPSSDWGAMSRTFRLGFVFLEEVAGRRLFDKDTKTAIECGDVHLVRVQWAATKKVKRVSSFLQVFTVIYGQTIARGAGIISIANHLGLDFVPFIDPETRLLNGVLFKKYHSKKLVFSVSMYDKLVRLLQMHQPLEELSEALMQTINGSVREDITAHSEGIIVIVKKAQKELRSWTQSELEQFDFISPEVFLEGDPKATLWWLQRAIFILSHYRHRGGELKRFSFGVWLVPFIEDDILHFDVIAGINSKGFHWLRKLRDPVAKAWVLDKPEGPDSWAERLAKAASVSPSTVYSRRDLWRTRCEIDIEFSLQFYSDVLHFGQASMAKPENITELLAAVNDENGEALLRLYREGLEDFERKRVTILNPALASRPRAMQLEGPTDNPVEEDEDVEELEDLSLIEPESTNDRKPSGARKAGVPRLFKAKHPRLTVNVRPNSESGDLK